MFLPLGCKLPKMEDDNWYIIIVAYSKACRFFDPAKLLSPNPINFSASLYSNVNFFQLIQFRPVVKEFSSAQLHRLIWLIVIWLSIIRKSSTTDQWHGATSVLHRVVSLVEHVLALPPQNTKKRASQVMGLNSNQKWQRFDNSEYVSGIFLGSICCFSSVKFTIPMR